MQSRVEPAARGGPGNRGSGVALSAATDAQLLAGCRARDPASWDTLVRRYERLVYSVALRGGLTPADAADVAQTTFVALLGAIDRLRDEERLAAWLVTVARRQSWRLRNISAREMPVAEPSDHGPEPIWADVAALHDALHRLGSPCDALLHALYFDPDRPSYAEIAQRLHRSVGGIGALRGRCLERIRRLLAEAGE